MDPVQQMELGDRLMLHNPVRITNTACSGTCPQRKLDILQQVAGIGFWELDLKTGHVWLDGRLQEIYGLSPGENNLGIELRTWRKYVHPEDQPRVQQGFWRAAELALPWRLQFRAIRPDQQVRHIRSEGRLEPIPNDQSVYFVGFEEDVTDRVALEQELERQAQQDGLTGTYNRRKMDNLLHQERERAIRYRQQLTAMLIDADGFKAINDNYGHEAGDELLHDLVHCCFRPCLRTIDHLGRWGGDEFLVILPETSEEAAYHVAERIRDQVETLQPGPGAITVSIGISAYQPEESPRDWLRSADFALYEAKRGGRNRITRYRSPPA
ncbi:GGDEF domain-containing protein [Halorhodospira halophila]|uniref:diguanylate cyclase n=1 Tax=Halorhodospira halophila (strain DSM 244 / SL1) TaxID=349124 RepID=A1WXD1_HALHL|nr:sensor domain-containing diguanylate cyclase [Halorhodospira halophila]ABM62343.1 diguanylate cyclase with PAS/PAC sensor [Halorhodospira halophila SL1]MBK1730056.1 hypothetical protein [Halorhodospira halophila]